MYRRTDLIIYVTCRLLEFLVNFVSCPVFWNVAHKQPNVGNRCVHFEKFARFDLKVV